MRIAFVNTLLDQARKNKDIMLLTGDLGYSVFEQFIKKMPKQFINMGVAEQNMAGVAAGLAMEGKIPLIYSIVPFTTMRNFEQIRNDICYQNLNVKIVGVGAGFSYGPYGHTHHGLEDIGILRTLANLVILSPGDPFEVEHATKIMLRHSGPVYLRLGRAGEPNVHTSRISFALGRGIVLQKGNDIAILATSTMLYPAKEVVDNLTNKGISVTFISMPSIKPLDVSLIVKAAKNTMAIFTLEEHSVIGGFGSAVAEVIAEHGIATIFKRIGTQDKFTKAIGLQEYMRRDSGLTTEQIIKTILTLTKSKKHG